MMDQEKKYLEIIDTIIAALDKEGAITFINKKGYEIIGYEEGELIGKNWFETFIPSNIKNEVYKVFKRLMKAEIKLVKYYENLIITKSGKEKIIYWHNTVLNDNEGNIIGILSSGEDITESKINEQKLKESEEKYHDLIENLMEMVIVVDNEGNIIFVNSRSFNLLGYQPEELIGKNLIPNLFNIKDFPFSINEKRDDDQSLGVRFIEHKTQHKDGHPIIISGKMVTRMNKNKIEHIGILRDITGQKKAKESIRIKNHAIESSSTPIIMTD